MDFIYYKIGKKKELNDEGEQRAMMLVQADVVNCVQLNVFITLNSMVRILVCQFNASIKCKCVSL